MASPPRTEDPRVVLQELLRTIRHELVRGRTVLTEAEQRMLIALVIAEVELGRAEPMLRRVDNALALAAAMEPLAEYAQRGREILDELLLD